MRLDLLDFPAGSVVAGAPARRYQSVSLESGFVVARTGGTLSFPTLAEEAGWRMEVVEGVPQFSSEGVARARRVAQTLLEVTMGSDRILLRVVEPAVPTLDWSLKLDAALSRSGIGTAALDVLADALLEQNHPLGERLRELPVQRFSDELWEGDLRLLERAARFDWGWARGMATAVIARTVSGLDRVSLHVLTHLVQSVELVLWEDASVEGACAAIDSLVLGGLPWLSSLTVWGSNVAGGKDLQRHWRSGRWRSRVPSQCRLLTPAPTRLVLKSSSGVTPIAERGPTHCGADAPLTFVRMRGLVPELTIGRSEFVLNGVLRNRPDPMRPWLVALRASDSFTLGSQTFALEAANSG